MKAVQAAPAAAGSVQQSHLLRCLSQLNDDVLASYLLPKLVQQGSARAVALSCSHMRRLCQHNTQHLDLTKQLEGGYSPCHNPELTRQLVAAFPNCTSLDFAWASSSMADVYRNIGQLLAGFSHLSTISIKLDEGRSDCDVDPGLAELHLHATGLQSLSLQLNTGWAENPVAWASLGKLVSLTKLHVSFDPDVNDPCIERNVAQLTGLSKLRSLCIMAPGALGFDHANEGQPVQFPGQLVRLTELHLPLFLLRDVSSVGDCASLCHLQLRAPEPYQLLPGIWKARHWDALARLTHLTHLHVDIQVNFIHEDRGLYGVLRQLPGLRAVGAYWWPPSALPVLQSLTQVTAVYGGWNVPGEVDRAVCPYVRHLGQTWFSVPFQAFPNLTSLDFSWVFAEHLLSLSRHCTGLQRLVLSPTPEGPCAMLCRGCSSTEGMLAMKSLANLQHLTHLELAPRTDAELTAFLSAAAAVSTLQLRYLSIRGPHSVFALMQLLTLRGLQEVSVHLTSSKVDFPVEGVDALLVGLAAVSKVSLRLCSEGQLARASAVQRLAQIGLPLPAVLDISMLPCDGDGNDHGTVIDLADADSDGGDSDSDGGDSDSDGGDSDSDGDLDGGGNA